MTMRAIISTKAGGPGALELANVLIPQPKAGEILIRVHSCSLNFPDLLVIDDKYQRTYPRPFSPGGEISGDVVALGEDAKGFVVGDAVIAHPGFGGMAEYAVAEAWRCILKPPAMPYDEAAGFLITYGTSFHALRQRGWLAAGDTLLVLGAAGGAGLSAVQLGHAAGANVVAAVSSQEKLELALAHGATSGFIYSKGPFGSEGRKALGEQFKTACGENGANVIYDAVGGDYAEPALRAIAFDGRYLVVGFPAGIPLLPLNLTLLKSCFVAGVFYGAWKQRHRDVAADNLSALVSLYEAGKIRPHISARFPLAQAGQALELFQSRAATGKIILTIG